MLGAKWSEINLAARLWTIPVERMKKGRREHRVPLSDEALCILEAMSELRVSDYVIFPGRNGALGHNAMLRELAALGRDDVDVHGFRSTFRDWAAETTAYPREVAEMALAHAIKGQSEAAYWRTDLFEKRRALMRDWAQRCAGGAVVLPLAGRLSAHA